MDHAPRRVGCVPPGRSQQLLEMCRVRGIDRPLVVRRTRERVACMHPAAPTAGSLDPPGNRGADAAAVRKQQPQTPCTARPAGRGPSQLVPGDLVTQFAGGRRTCKRIGRRRGEPHAFDAGHELTTRRFDDKVRTKRRARRGISDHSARPQVRTGGRVPRDPIRAKR